MDVKSVSYSVFLRAVKRATFPTVHHDLKHLIWTLKTNKCVWMCCLGCDSAAKVLDVELELKLAKIENITFHHFGA